MVDTVPPELVRAAEFGADLADAIAGNGEVTPRLNLCKAASIGGHAGLVRRTEPLVANVAWDLSGTTARSMVAVALHEVCHVLDLARGDMEEELLEARAEGFSKAWAEACYLAGIGSRWNLDRCPVVWKSGHQIIQLDNGLTFKAGMVRDVAPPRDWRDVRRRVDRVARFSPWRAAS